MISNEKVRELLVDIENASVERTISTDNTDKFAKAVCAFANDLPNTRKPGYLMIGAYDNGMLNGLKVSDRLLRNLAGLRADGNIQPKPALMVWKSSFPDGDIAVVEVQPSKVTPVKYKEVTYVRIGARKAEANEEEERLLREKSEVKSYTYDTSPCFQCTIDDLDLNLFKKEYLPKMVKKKVLQNENRNIKQQLASLNLFNIQHDCPTVAGILLVGKDPTHILFGAYIQYVAFAGKKITSKILNERQFSGNIITLLKEIDYFIKYSIQKQRPVFVSVLREEMRINYPYEAIRELAMNLVMHRNYQTNAPAKFYEYSDRIEIENPGNLYGKVHPENFPNANDYRNPVIAEAMKTLGYVNRFNRGVNMVQEILEENNNGVAIFDFKDNYSFKVTVNSADLDAVRELGNGADGAENGTNGIENNADGIENRVDGAENGADGIENCTDGAEKSADGAENGADGAENGADGKNSGADGEENGATDKENYSEIILSLIKKDNRITRNTIAVKLNIGTTTVFRYIESLKNQGIIERIGGDKGGYWNIKK